jgi:hypothetical protein
VELGDAAALLAALASKADAAVDRAQRAEVAETFAAVVVGSSSSRQACGRHRRWPWRQEAPTGPAQAAAAYSIAAVNRTHRRTRQQAAGGASLAGVGRCRNRVKRLVSAAWHECHQRRGAALERQARDGVPQSKRTGAG